MLGVVLASGGGGVDGGVGGAEVVAVDPEGVVQDGGVDLAGVLPVPLGVLRGVLDVPEAHGRVLGPAGGKAEGQEQDQKVLHGSEIDDTGTL